MALRRGLLRLVASSTSAPLRSACRASPSVSLQVRDFSTGQAPKKKEASVVKIPIQVHGIAGRYAVALYKTAVPANKMDQVYEDLNELLKSIEKSPTFGEFLKDLSVPNKEKVKAVRDIFGELKFTDISVNFLALLAENGRIQNFKEVMQALSELMMAYRKQVKATVATVTELKPKELEDLKKSLKRFVPPDHTIMLEQKIDRRIMGGLVVEIGEKYIDLSIATKLRNMERVLREPLPDLV
ncbi:hypothetical protein GOP47_0001224 [Adiantum capillus-veneris]|uniref:ATP synthase subunit O, mitochondrial n=1 Tax=Adiantum capillus-veneris TaxID=13818 RepID=A0A9D4VFF4_ADICA|nr:hypothetical protein GOP47_0000091 [Adiantum capillus-veneris]KAI5085055.1 hypothetical protein GOP47_0001224 [Adiantum capillus-veneris]